MVRHILQFFVWSLFAGSLISCASIRDGNQFSIIESIPTGATVSIEGFGECETPCTIQHNITRRIVVAKAGYLPQNFDVRAGAGKIRVQLELAAPTEGVEEQALPEL